MARPRDRLHDLIYAELLATLRDPEAVTTIATRALEDRDRAHRRRNAMWRRATRDGYHLRTKHDRGTLYGWLEFP